ncbi:hypothetical protein SLE2022_135000 [Rubroshorea leprosula]
MVTPLKKKNMQGKYPSFIFKFNLNQNTFRILHAAAASTTSRSLHSSATTPPPPSCTPQPAMDLHSPSTVLPPALPREPPPPFSVKRPPPLASLNPLNLIQPSSPVLKRLQEGKEEKERCESSRSFYCCRRGRDEKRKTTPRLGTSPVARDADVRRGQLLW